MISAVTWVAMELRSHVLTPHNGSEPPLSLSVILPLVQPGAQACGWIYRSPWVFCESLVVASAAAAHSAPQGLRLPIHWCLWHHPGSRHHLKCVTTTTSTARPLLTVLSSCSCVTPMSTCPWPSTLIVKMWLRRTWQASS